MKEQESHPALLTDEELNPYVPSPQSTGDRSEEGFSDFVELTERGMICHERTVFPPVCVVSGETENLVIMPLTPAARPHSSRILRIVAFVLLLFPAIALGGWSLMQFLFNINTMGLFQLLPWTIVASIASIPFFIISGFGHIKCAFQLSLGQKAHERWKSVNRIAGLSGYLPAAAFVLSNAAPRQALLFIWGPFILWMLVLLPILKRWQLNGLTTIRVKALESGVVEVTGLSEEFRQEVRRILDANKSAPSEELNIG